MRMDDNPPEADHIIAAPDGVEVVTSCASLGESVVPGGVQRTIISRRPKVGGETRETRLKARRNADKLLEELAEN
jgi:hypothetical protein